MRVLIGGEFSGRVRDAFLQQGHDAVSCDYRASEAPGPHYQGSWLDQEILKQHWDLGIFRPDCTYLVVSGARWMTIEWREEAQLAALHTVKAIWKLPIGKIAIENPIGKLSSLWRGPDQIIEPFHFGDPFKKATCLWLKNLPALVATNNLGRGEQACWKEPPGPERKKNRARTYQGIADAMAAQWGGGADMRYCEMCDAWVRQKECPKCGADTVKAVREDCYQCDGDGYGPGAGNCPRCGGGGKEKFPSEAGERPADV